MWKRVENGDTVRPAAVDETSSRNYVYVRRNITPVAAREDIPAHYEWEEMKIRKEDWAVYRQIPAHDEALEDVFAALAELAALVTEV